MPDPASGLVSLNAQPKESASKEIKEWKTQRPYLIKCGLSLNWTWLSPCDVGSTSKTRTKFSLVRRIWRGPLVTIQPVKTNLEFTAQWGSGYCRKTYCALQATPVVQISWTSSIWTVLLCGFVCFVRTWLLAPTRQSAPIGLPKLAFNYKTKTTS